MPRLLILIALLVLALPAVAHASTQDVYDDCDNGRMDERHSEADLRKALREVPEDLDEYTNCSELIRGALAGVDTSGSGGAGGGGNVGAGPSGLPQGNGVGSVPLGPDGKPLDPLIDAAEDERREIGAAQAGRDIAPTAAGVRPGDPEAELPVPLIVVLALALLAALAAAVPRARELATGAPALRRLRPGRPA